jgi:hypothetical protein
LVRLELLVLVAQLVVLVAQVLLHLVRKLLQHLAVPVVLGALLVLLVLVVRLEP